MTFDNLKNIFAYRCNLRLQKCISKMQQLAKD